ncbi:methyl-CpG-binding domain protein 2-like [Styela clava]
MSGKRHEVAELPKGWTREEVIRQNGMSRGKTDIYYYSPSGKKFRSKPDLQRELGVDLTYFHYRAGKYMRDKVKLQQRNRLLGRNGRSDLDTSLPVRQTASIFKQPVTKRTNHKSSKVKQDATRNQNKSPQQLFKEKRLSGLNAIDVSNNIITALDLPKALQAVGPDTSSDALLRRIATQLHHGGPPITGQTSSVVMKDACVWLNTQQPLCKAFVVTEDDVRKQERRVQLARERLEAALRHQDVLQRQELVLQG